MRKILFFAVLALCTAAAFGQDDFTSSRLQGFTDRLKRDSVDLADQTSADLRRSSNLSRAMIEETFLAAQIDASAGVFQDMVRDRRSAAELRDAATLLSEMARRAPSYSNNSRLWRDVQNSIGDINRELGNNGGGGSGGGGNDGQILGRVFWRGMVDDRVQLIIKGNQIETRTVSGTSYPAGTFSFTSSLPTRQVSVGANRTKGRGSVKVLQQPSKTNDFTAIVEIYDDGGGAREYQLDIFWR